MKIRLLSALALTLAAAVASAQEFPTKPITFVVPFAAGSATDQIARALGQSVSEQLKQSVVIDNKPGASGFLAAQQAAKASALPCVSRLSEPFTPPSSTPSITKFMAPRRGRR